ncbi:hypothetical protein KUCAC02_029817, partial [Chaenocephalus aceratus]
ELSVGESKFFICTAIGEPVRASASFPPNGWLFTLKRHDPGLIIYNAIIEDAGIYRCQATDANGPRRRPRWCWRSTALIHFMLRERHRDIPITNSLGTGRLRERLTFRDVQSPQEFRHGETAEVVCDVISSPVPVVVWYYQDKEITEEHHTLDTPSSIETKAHIHQVTKADEGVYRCEASVEARGEIDFVDIAMVVKRSFVFSYQSSVQMLPEIPEGQKGMFRVFTGRGRGILPSILIPPVLSVFQPAFNATADYQESVTFTCMTSGSPDPLVTWHSLSRHTDSVEGISPPPLLTVSPPPVKHLVVFSFISQGQQLEPSEQYIIARLDGGRSMLTIRNIRQGDGGTYTCRATNKAGSQEREIFLKVFVQPHITQLKNVTAVEGSAAMISCGAEGEPLPDISWRRASDGKAFTDGDKRRAGPLEVVPGGDGGYLCGNRLHRGRCRAVFSHYGRMSITG